MGCTNQYFSFSHKSQPLVIIFFLFLLLSTFTTHCSFIAPGRAIAEFSEPAKREMRNEDINLEEMVMMRRIIGSRPPRCDQICYSCSHCEAVQVPVVLAQKLKSQRFLKSEEEETQKTIFAYSNADYISNYKPMCWKCKCGDLIFNP